MSIDFSHARVVRIPLVTRTLLLTVSLIACVLLQADGTGAQSSDDHGNFLNTATPLTLGASVAGRIDSGDDRDVFRLDLSVSAGIADVWIYTTGATDTLGGLYDSTGQNIAVNEDSGIIGRRKNFHLRASLNNGTYYIGVFGGTETVTGNYILHTEVVTDPGSTPRLAKHLQLDAPAGGTIDTESDVDSFRLDLTESKYLYIYASSVFGESIGGYVLDGQGHYVGTNLYDYDDEFLIRDDFGPGTHYIQVITHRDDTRHPVPYTIHALEDVEYTDFLQYCENATRQLNAPQVRDSLYGCQWHLNNPTGQDINVESVWSEGIKGEGVNIAVVDDGMYFQHEDLKDNVNSNLNHDYTGRGSIFHPFEHHGTSVAGVLAARDNGIGVRGVAPQSTIYGYNILANSTDLNVGDALTRNRGITAVSNNSWGKASSPGFRTVPQIFTLAFDQGINNGYGGKGTFYVFSAGNGHRIGSHANLSELLTHRGVTAVCAVNDSDVRASYSEVGANLWICAPSGEATLSEYREIITTENYDRYNYLADGTSMSAPIVSGVAALMRDANPELTWRDLKLILAASARKNDPANAGWLTGAPKYRAEQNTDTYHFNHRYGFGVVDAQAAVTLAKNWQTLPPMLTSTVESGSLNGRVPDAPLTGTPSTVYHQLTLDTDVEFAEFVEVNVTFNHPSFRDLSIALVSPSGAVSILALPFDTSYTPDDPDDIDIYPLVGSFRLGSARHLGEDPNGTWTLYVTDNFHGDEGVLASWNLTVYGHAQPPPAPQVEVSFAESAYTVTEGGSVTVAISLNADPQRTVAVPITVTNLHGAVAADYSGIPESVTFINGGPTQQLVTITATDDRIADANESVNLGFGALPERVSTGATAETTVAITDNDIAGVTVAPTSLTVLEGASENYTVKLNTQPSETVTVTVLIDNTGVTATPENLVFNSATWNTPQTVTVTAAQDDDAQDDYSTLTHTVIGYGTVTTAYSVAVTVTDDEPPVEVNFAQSAYSVPEGDSVTVILSLSADPQRTVAVPIVVTHQGGATDDDYSGVPESVTFAGGGPTQQTFKITTTDDQIVDPNERVKLGFGVLPIKATAGATAESIVSITDNDAAGMPTVQMTLTETPLVRLRVGIPVTVRFDQTVSGFGIDDVAVTNGRPENLTGESGGTDYSFDLVPTAISVVTVDVAAGAAQNAQGQDSLAAPQLRVGLPYDDDHDGRINRAEVITAIGDYLFGGQLTRDDAIAIIGLYLFG